MKTLFLLIRKINPKSHLRLLAVLLFISIATLSAIYIPLILKDIVDALQGSQTQSTTMNYFLLLAAITILGRICAEAKFQIYAKWESQLLSHTLLHFYSAILRNQPQYFENNKTGSITSRIILSAFGLKSFLFDFLFHLLPLFLEIALIIPIIAIELDKTLSFILLIGIGTYLFLMAYLNDRLLGYQKAIRNATVDAQGCLTDHLSGWKDILLFNGRHKTQPYFEEHVNTLTKSTNLFYKKRTLFGLIQALLIATTFLTANYMVIRSGINGSSSIGGIILINGYLLQLLRPLESFGLLYRNITHAYTEYSSIFECLPQLMSSSNDTPANDNAHSAGMPPSLQIKGLSKEGILNNIDASWTGPISIALIGKTGSGKTSLLNTIAGLDQNYNGSINLNNQDVRDLSPVKLQERIAYFPSDARLFSMSIKDNLMLNQSADDAMIHELLYLLELDDKIAALALEELTSEQANHLSNGEKQRIKLARTLLSNKPIMLFDESTSALDPATEERLIQRLMPLNRGIILFATHRLTYLDKFDLIIQIKNGRLFEIKNHRDLLQQEEGNHTLCQTSQSTI